MLQQRSRLWAALFVIFTLSLGLSLFAQNLNGDFILDDFPNLEALITLKKGQNASFSNILNFLAINNSGQIGRFIPLLSFALQADHWPSNAAPFKFVNALIHLLNGVLITLISQYLLRQWVSSLQQKWVMAVIIGALWLVQPIHVSTVLYVVQRMTLLMAFFSLLAIGGYLYGRQLSLSRVKFGLFVATFSVVFGGLLAVFSKENGVLVLLYIAVIEFTLYSRQEKSRHWKVWMWAVIYLPLIGGGHYFITHLSNYIGGYGGRNFTLAERLLTEGRILVEYLTKILLPRPNAFGLFFDDYLISTGILTPISTLFSLAALAVALILAFAWRLKQPVLSFAILWFFAGHVLESTIIPLELYFEHRNYLPAFGIIFALVYYAVTLSQKASANYVKYCFIALSVIYCSGIYFIAYQEAALWNDSALQAITWQKKHPTSKRATALAAQTWLDLNRPLQADRQLQHIHDLDNQDSAAFLMRLSIHCYTQHLTDVQLDEILHNLQRTKTENATVRTLKELVGLWGNGNCKGLSRDYMENILKAINHNTSPGRLKTHLLGSFSLFYAFNDQYPQAIELLDEGIRQMPTATELVLLKIRWAVASGQYDSALQWIQEAKFQNNAQRLRKINFENQLSLMENDIHVLKQHARNQNNDGTETSD